MRDTITFEDLEDFLDYIDGIERIDTSDPLWGSKTSVKLSEKQDNVNHPSHYTTGDIEVIDYIKDKLDKDAYEGYCIGNVIKYVSRYKHKNGKEDLEKAFTYLKWAIEGKKVGK